MKRMLACLLTSALILTGCSSGISKNRYENLRAKNEKIISENKKIVKENKKLKEENEKLVEENKKLKEEAEEETSIPTPEPTPASEPTTTPTPKDGKVSITELSNAGGRLKTIFDCQDLYGNTYSKAIDIGTYSPELITAGRYTRFTTTAFINNVQTPEGGTIKIYADGKVIYEKAMPKTSSPINIDVDITGCQVLSFYTPVLSCDILYYDPCVQ